MLIGIWLAGVASGVVLCQFLKDAILSLMSSVLCNRSSIFALLLTTTAPLIVAFLCHRYHFFFLVYLTAFAEAFVIGFSVYAVVLFCGSAGWLIHILLLFHCYVCAACGFWLWLRQFSNHTQTFFREFSVCALLMVTAGGLDYFFVSPFLVTLWH